MATPVQHITQPPKLFARLKLALIVLALEALVLGSIGGVLFLGPDRDDTTNLPAPESLTLTKGTVTGLTSSSDEVKGPSVMPQVEFTLNGTTYQITTRNSYRSDLWPYQQGATLGVLYNPAQPQAAWLQWEYDRIQARNDAITGKAALAMVFAIVAAVIVAVTLLWLVVYLVRPPKQAAPA